jgi:hypothetical protein
MPFGALANLGVGIAGLAGAFDPDKPAPRNLSQEVQDYIKVLPQILSAQQLYSPQFAELYSKMQQRSLFGTPGGTRTEQYIQDEVQPAHEVTLKPGEPIPSGYVKVRDNRGPNTGQYGRVLGPVVSTVYKTPSFSQPVVKSRTVNTEAVPGSLDIYARALPQLTELYNAQQKGQLASNVESYGLYGPKIREAFANTYPEYDALLQSLLGSAKEDADSAGGLSPLEERQLQQSVRGAYAARGLNQGPGAANMEALRTNIATAAKRDQKLTSASRLATLYGASVPSLQVPGISAPLASSGALAGLFGASGAAGQFGAQQFGTPFNGYSQDLYNTNLGLDWDYNKIIANIRAQSANQTAQGAASLAGAAAGACWVAREVLGTQDNRWMQFRDWLLTKAPASLREQYLAHGEALAAWLKDKPSIKALIARNMLAIIGNRQSAI